VDGFDVAELDPGLVADPGGDPWSRTWRRPVVANLPTAPSRFGAGGRGPRPCQWRVL